MLKADIGLLGDWGLEIRELGDQEYLYPIPKYPNTQILIPQSPNHRI